MTAMEPTPTQKNATTVTCPCGWSTMVPGESWVAESLDYHRIQVHNDQDAVKRNRRF